MYIPTRVFKYEVSFTNAKGKDVCLHLESVEAIEELSKLYDFSGSPVHVKRGQFHHFIDPQPWD